MSENKQNILIIAAFVIFFAIIIYNKYTLNKSNESIVSLKEENLRLRENSISGSLGQALFRGEFIFVENKDFNFDNFDSKKGKLPLDILNLVYYIGNNSCKSCILDYKYFLNYQKEGNLQVSIIIAPENLDVLDSFPIDVFTNIYIDYQRVFSKFDNLVPVKILFFNNGDILSMQWGELKSEKELLGEEFLHYAEKISKLITNN